MGTWSGAQPALQIVTIEYTDIGEVAFCSPIFRPPGAPGPAPRGDEDEGFVGRRLGYAIGVVLGRFTLWILIDSKLKSELPSGKKGSACGFCEAISTRKGNSIARADGDIGHSRRFDQKSAY